MKSFFKQKYGCCNIALATLLATGCTVFPPLSEQEATPPPAVAVDASKSAPASAPALAPLPIDYPVRDVAVTQSETVLLRKQLEEHIRFQKLLEDLAHYPDLNPEETQRLQADLNNRISTRGQSGGNSDRVRLAYLLSLHPSGINDQRAMSILDTVVKNEKTLIPLQHLASVLRAQIQEKQRALQKLEALREVDRRLLEERMSTNKTSPPPRETPKRP
jgi:hypothetical protein